MTGRQLAIRSLGAGYESFAETVIGRIASMAQVPYEQDYGVDFYALPRLQLPGRTETVVELCSIQVKGGDQDTVTFGGMGKKGEWKQHELDWFRGLNVPLYIAAVDREFTEVRLYSTSPVFGVFFRAGTPFKITCTLGDPAINVDASIPEPSSEPAESGTGGDGRHWKVALGAPLLQLRLPALLDEGQRTNARDVFIAWIQADRLAQLYLQQHIPLHTVPLRYRTNHRPMAFTEWIFWNTTPGTPSVGLEQRLAPIATVLVQHLLGQKDAEGLAAWLPALKWLDGRDNLTAMGKGAITEITAMGAGQNGISSSL